MGDAEVKIYDMLMYPDHFWVMVGIFCVMYCLRFIQVIDRFLFCPPWKFLLVIINIGLASIGIFGLGMTSAKTFGMKIIIVFLISAVTLLAHEITKPILRAVIKKIFGIDVKSNT